jgi:hypothetical protein
MDEHEQDGHILWLPEGAMNQIVFSLQAKLVVDSYELLADYAQGGYKQMGDRAKLAMTNRYRYQPRMCQVIVNNLTPIMKGNPIPWERVMKETWDETPVDADEY